MKYALLMSAALLVPAFGCKSDSPTTEAPRHVAASNSHSTVRSDGMATMQFRFVGKKP